MRITYAILLLVIVQHCFSNDTPCKGLIDKNATEKFVIPSGSLNRFDLAIKSDSGLLSANKKFCLVSYPARDLSVWSILKKSAPVHNLCKSGNEKLAFIRTSDKMKVACGRSFVVDEPYRHQSLVGVQMELEDNGALKFSDPNGNVIWETRPSCDGLLQQAEEEHSVKSYVDIDVPSYSRYPTTIYLDVSRGLLSKNSLFCSFMTPEGLKVFSTKGEIDKDFLWPRNDNRDTSSAVYLKNDPFTNAFSFYIGQNFKTIERPVLTGVQKVRLLLDDDGQLKLLANSSIVWSSHGVRQPVDLTTHKVEFEELCHKIPSSKDILQQNNTYLWDNSVVSLNGSCTFGLQGNKTCGTICSDNKKTLRISDCTGVRLMNCLMQFIKTNRTLSSIGIKGNMSCYLRLSDNGGLTLHSKTDGRVMWPIKNPTS